MPLIDVVQTKKVVATVTLEESTAENVDKYAAFLQASADDVVTKALDYVFSKDKDFQEFLKNPSEQKATVQLRVRRPADEAGKPKRGRKPAVKS